MLRLDKEEGDVVDWDFLDKYTVGFDADHKPEDLKEDVNFLDYLNGKYDGIEKTAEWASEICGVTVEQITYFAREIGKTHNVWMLHNFAAARCNGSENLPQIFMTVSAMGGHYGKPGNCSANNYHANAGNGGPALVKGGSSGLPSVKNPIDGVIPRPQAWEACLTVNTARSATGTRATGRKRALTRRATSTASFMTRTRTCRPPEHEAGHRSASQDGLCFREGPVHDHAGAVFRHRAACYDSVGGSRRPVFLQPRVLVLLLPGHRAFVRGQDRCRDQHAHP